MEEEAAGRMPSISSFVAISLVVVVGGACDSGNNMVYISPTVLVVASSLSVMFLVVGKNGLGFVDF